MQSNNFFIFFSIYYQMNLYIIIFKLINLMSNLFDIYEKNFEESSNKIKDLLINVSQTKNKGKFLYLDNNR